MVDVGAQIGTTTRKQLLAEGLFHLIGERIISGELAPGTRIRDAELAVELSVSRTPVREALQRLERIGLVTMYPSRYTEVTHVDAAAIAVAHTFAGLQAGIIVRLSAPRLTPDEVETATGLIDDVAETVDDAAACSSARRKLVGFLAARTGNSLQQTLVDDASLALARTLRELEIPQDRRPVVIAACADLAAALRAQDPDAAEQACRTMYGVN